MMTYGQYLEGNRRALHAAEADQKRDHTADHGPILMLAMHRIGRVSFALSIWAAIRIHGMGTVDAVRCDSLRKEILDFAAHATVLLERIAARVEADTPPGNDDATELCYVTARAHKCTSSLDCPSCNAQRLMDARAQAYEAEQAAESSGKLLN